MKLSEFDNRAFERGRPSWVEACWRVLEGLLFASWLPGSGWRAGLLRLFGARIGRGVVIKPRVRVKFPWRLEVGDHSWIGESVWIDNLAPVRIGHDCCLSQGAYLCTGSHDWVARRFDLVVKPITIADRAWLAAGSRLAPGVAVGEGAVLGLGAVATGDLQPWTIYAGNPAVPVRERRRA
jgi:putative colanic acid biosynthesis acetyltransferase WcaF